MKKQSVGIIGLGYVGLPLAVKFVQAGFEVLGIDTDTRKLKMIRSGKSYIDDIDSADLKNAVRSGRFCVSDDFSCLSRTNVICVCVPTPLDKNKQPDISYIEHATEKIAKTLKKGQLIILESTTYPGTTEEIMLPAFEAKGLRVGRDFNLVFSPERVDPGNKKFKLNDVPKVIGGITEKCSARAAEVYSRVFEKIHIVSSPKVAETEKLLENIFRNVNIALVNELAILCRRMDIDVWEVIAAAKTKPYGYMAFYPGPGIGGHCIPLDPFYLSWKAKEYGIRTRFIELAGEINDKMPEYTVRLLQDILNERNISLKDAKVLVLGLSYKKDINDMRESPAVKVIEQLFVKGAAVSYSDPHVPEARIGSRKMKSVVLNQKNVSSADAVIVLTDHSAFDYEKIVDNARLVLDTRNAVKSKKNSKKVIKL
ncbi:MAG: nucleotide sugar dehydrogenase [Candidatus Margulisiibacteriota bacterium]